MLIYSKRKRMGSHAVESLLAFFGPVLIRRKMTIKELPKDPVIVLIEPFQLGDVLSLAVMIDPILKDYPKARLVICCHTKNAHVYAGDSRIWKVVDAPFPWSNRGSKRGTLGTWREVLRACLRMRSYKPDVGIDPRGDVRSQAVLYLAGCSSRIGYTTYVGSNLQLHGRLLSERLDDPPIKHRYLTNLYVLKPLLSAVPNLSLPALIAPLSDSEEPIAERSMVLIHPGAGWVFRRWPKERWRSLIEDLQQLPSVRLIQIAGPGELELTEEISRSLRQPIETRSTNYQELLTLISQCSLFIGLDSGPMNLAVLLNVPVIALFGPGESSVWRPLSKSSRFFHHVENYPCHPCIQLVCVRPDDSCITTIHTDEVSAAARGILGYTQELLPIL